VVTFIWPFSASIIGSNEYRRVGGFLRFLAFFAVLAAVLLFVVVPLLAGPFLTQMVRDTGVRSNSLQVSIALFDPTLLLGRSRSMHIAADEVDMSPASVGAIKLTLGGVSFFDQTWETVDGEMRDIRLTTGGHTFEVDTLTVDGPANAANATARLSAEETEELIRFAAEREGLRIDDVKFSDDGVRVSLRGVDAEAQLDVRGGALVLVQPRGQGGVALIQPAPSDPWQLSEAWVSDDGLNLRGVVDTTRLVEGLAG
jgi:hypothetical protein